MKTFFRRKAARHFHALILMGAIALMFHQCNDIKAIALPRGIGLGNLVREIGIPCQETDETRWVFEPTGAFWEAFPHCEPLVTFGANGPIVSFDCTFDVADINIGTIVIYQDGYPLYKYRISFNSGGIMVEIMDGF